MSLNKSVVLLYFECFSQFWSPHLKTHETETDGLQRGVSKLMDTGKSPPDSHLRLEVAEGFPFISEGQLSF